MGVNKYEICSPLRLNSKESEMQSLSAWTFLRLRCEPVDDRPSVEIHVWTGWAILATSSRSSRSKRWLSLQSWKGRHALNSCFRRHWQWRRQPIHEPVGPTSAVKEKCLTDSCSEADNSRNCPRKPSKGVPDHMRKKRPIAFGNDGTE